MAYETFAKRGKRSRMGPKPDKYSDRDVSPTTMYYEPEVGNRSRQTGRMFNWMKGESY